MTFLELWEKIKMKINTDFLVTLQEAIYEILNQQSPLLESPVRSQQQLMVERKIKRIMMSPEKKNVENQD